MLSVELVIDSVTVTVAVTVAVAKLVVVQYCSTVVANEAFFDGTKARPTARARRHTVVMIRTPCRFMLRVSQLHTYSNTVARIKPTQEDANSSRPC